MSDIFMKRELIKQAYPTRRWYARVDKMSDNQIIAIFIKLRNEGRIK